MVGSGGSVSLNYSTGVVTGAIDGAGAGTSFGSVGAAKTGDIIRFGSRGPESSTGGTGTFFGDAVAAGTAAASALHISLCTYMGALRAPVYVHSEIFKAEAAAAPAATASQKNVLE